MKAHITEVKKKIASYVHSAFLDSDYINDQDLSAVNKSLSLYSNVKVGVDKTRFDDGYLECRIQVDAFFGGGTLRYEIRSNGKKKKYYDPLAWIDEIEKWDALLF